MRAPSAAYDPARNAIYVDSADRAAVARVRPASGAPVRVPSSATVFTLADELRQQLASGQARVEGHATIGGRDTIKIALPSARITTMVCHAYAQLPASGNGGLVSLTAQHPTATVDNGRADYRAAIARLLRSR